MRWLRRAPRREAEGTRRGRGARPGSDGVVTDLSLVRDALAAGSGERRTYLVRHVPDHGYKKGPKGARGCKATRSDLQPCNAARPHPAHYLPTANTALVNDW